MTDHYHAGDSSPCDKDCPPSRRETREAAKKLVREILMKHGICSSEGEDALVADLASALSEKQARIEMLEAEAGYHDAKEALAQCGEQIKLLTTRNEALRGALRLYGGHIGQCLMNKVDDDSISCICGLSAALASPHPGEQASLSTFTALGDPVHPTEEGLTIQKGGGAVSEEKPLTKSEKKRLCDLLDRLSKTEPTYTFSSTEEGLEWLKRRMKNK